MRTTIRLSLWCSAAMLLSAVGTTGQAATYSPGPLVGKKAPAFQVQGIYREAYSLETFKGHILVMQFGASW